MTNPDFAKFIEAFGGHGEVVSDTAEFAPAFRRAVDSGRPAVIELRMNPEQITTRATIAELRAGKRAQARGEAEACGRAEASEAGARRARRQEAGWMSFGFSHRFSSMQPADGFRRRRLGRWRSGSALLSRARSMLRPNAAAWS